MSTTTNNTPTVDTCYRMSERDIARVDITAKDIRDALERPDSFGLSSDHEHYDDMFRTWSLGPVFETRGSNLIDKSNAIALRRMLAAHPELADEWCETGCRHWACGWVTHLSFHAVDEHGEPTRMFRVVKAWFDMLSEYSLADESLHSELEHDELCKNIPDILRDVRRDLVREFDARREADPSDGDMSHDEIVDWLDDMSDDDLWDIVHDIGETYDGWLHLSRRDIEKAADVLLAKEDTE